MNQSLIHDTYIENIYKPQNKHQLHKGLKGAHRTT